MASISRSNPAPNGGRQRSPQLTPGTAAAASSGYLHRCPLPPDSEQPAPASRGRRGWRTGSVAALAQSARFLSRLTGAGGGSSLPGLIVERLDPGFVAAAGRRLSGGVIAVSGTNGKTTTSSMIRDVLKAGGLATVGNESGANLSRGIATALLDTTDDTEFAVLEIDEGSLDGLIPLLRPRALVLTNIFRDQLDRFGETERVAELFARAARNLPEGGRVIANADDPLLWDAVEGCSVTGFGVAGAPGRGGAPASREPQVCPRCKAPLIYTEHTIGHLGAWRCDRCGFGPDGEVSRAVLTSRGGSTGARLDIDGLHLDLSVGGVHNAYNAVAALTACIELGVVPEAAAGPLEAFRGRFGRNELINMSGREVRLLLMKNPAGASVAIEDIASDPRVGAVVVAVNDRAADGRDVSWIWDVDFESLVGPDVVLVPSGRRAQDVALRLKYAGGAPEAAHRSAGGALRSAIERCPQSRSTIVLATYTAMLELRSAVWGRGAARLTDVSQ